MYAVTHPSLPNYLALTGGSTFGIDSDCTDCSVSTTGLADQFAGRGLSWKAYMEGLPYPCFTGPAPATTPRILAGSHPAGRLLDVRSALGGGQMMQRFVPAEHPDRAKRLIRALASHTDSTPACCCAHGTPAAATRSPRRTSRSSRSTLPTRSLAVPTVQPYPTTLSWDDTTGHHSRPTHLGPQPVPHPCTLANLSPDHSTPSQDLARARQRIGDGLQ